MACRMRGELGEECCCCSFHSGLSGTAVLANSVDRAVAAGTLENPIATGVDHSRHLAVAWHIFPTVPSVPLRIDLGGDGHAANLQYRRHATVRHFHAVR